MGHLTAETLARLVDDAPRPGEAEHLARCDVCAAELQAYRDGTAALAALPEILPPMGDWEVLEARLRSEGLVRDRARFERLGLATTPTWMRVAAAAVLFLGGTGLGAALTSRAATRGEATLALMSDQSLFVGSVSVEDAASAVRVAEQNYVTALARYRQLLAAEGGGAVPMDPQSRYAALEYLVAAGQAAVRQAPADPFLNGLLASTLAERDATLRTISRKDNWF